MDLPTTGLKVDLAERLSAAYLRYLSRDHIIA